MLSHSRLILFIKTRISIINKNGLLLFLESTVHHTEHVEYQNSHTSYFGCVFVILFGWRFASMWWWCCWFDCFHFCPLHILTLPEHAAWLFTSFIAFVCLLLFFPFVLVIYSMPHFVTIISYTKCIFGMWWIV